MQSQLKWKKKIFSNLYRIYSNVGEIGHLKERSFSNTTTAALHKDRYTFKTTGFLDPLTEIIDEAENKVIGKIKYGKWMTKATIYFDGKEVYWKYDNMWNTEWRIFNEEGIDIRYNGFYSKGNIQTNTNDPLLLLSGLFITNYFWQTLVIIFIAIFLPIFLGS